MVMQTVRAVCRTHRMPAAECVIQFDFPSDADEEDVLGELTKAYVEAAGKIHTFCATRDALRLERESPDPGVQPH
jgi:hypothetical protein